MILLLQVLAVVLTVLGVVTLYLGNDPSMLSLGNTLMIVGAISAVGGLLLVGLAVIAGRLDTLARGIDGLKLGLAPAPAFVPPVAPVLDVAPRPAPADPETKGETAPEPVVPVPPSAEPYRAEPYRAEPSIEPVRPEPLRAEPGNGAPREPARIEPPHVEPVRVEPVHVEPERIEPPRIEPVRVEPAASSSPAPVEFPKRPTSFRDRFGWKPAVTAAGIAAAAGVAATAKPGKPGDDAVPTPSEPDTKGSTDTRGATGGESLEAAISAAIADVNTPAAEPRAEAGDTPRAGAGRAEAPAVTAPRHLDDDDLMARLRASILGPEPVSAPGAGTAEAPARGEPVVEKAVAAEPAKAPALSIEDELELALKTALGRDVAPVADLRDQVVPPPAPVVPPPEPAAGRQEQPSGDRAMAALARDFPELGDILARPAEPDRDRRVAGEDDGDISDGHAHAIDTHRPMPGEDQPAAAPEPAAEAVPVVAAEPEPAAVVEAAPVVAAEPPPPSAPTAPLLREGVIAGIPFRLFGDGSIEADLASGTARFASLKDFRAHVGG
ncbi:hypothetical protein [Phreatobacter stygius]|uniref:DUF308 domain-containing protein n=1 Tax=Phreatobacter stygius TaxID=1940610 RepID=A0A4D7AYU4_9HYPH|nr:hypothetical protein [Phreatobacter stygius]QCI66509.1 hypothetical protein E8M01_21125 [Phreatobacter stygius]